ncbi:MAG: peptide-methionine (S)-S-oxide reductase MsrA [Thermoplasmatota archaeon]
MLQRSGSLRTATFAAGCFWGVEAAFRELDGVISTMVGYTGGTTLNPSYKEVCTGTTGHAEAVQLSYDPDVISYEELLDVFWDIHDPTQRDRQGPDVGSQYRSAIFYHDEEQRQAAEQSRRQLQQSGRLHGDIATEITQAEPFYPAEKYHQRYYEKHGCRR